MLTHRYINYCFHILYLIVINVHLNQTNLQNPVLYIVDNILMQQLMINRFSHIMLNISIVVQVLMDLLFITVTVLVA